MRTLTLPPKPIYFSTLRPSPSPSQREGNMSMMENRNQAAGGRQFLLSIHHSSLSTQHSALLFLLSRFFRCQFLEHCCAVFVFRVEGHSVSCSCSCLLPPAPASCLLTPDSCYSSFPNQPRRSIHFANSSTGETVKAAPIMISQSFSV